MAPANSSIVVVTLDNRNGKAAFTMDNIICPEDGLVVKNNSTGHFDLWEMDL